MNPSLENHTVCLVDPGLIENHSISKLLQGQTMREKLCDDGADYRCCFEFLTPGYEPWQCPRSATEALDVETYEKLELPKTIFLHGRVMCEAHLLMLEA